MVSRKVRIKFAISLLMALFLIPISQASAGLITSVPDLCSQPSGEWLLLNNDVNNNDYVTFGNESGECVMSVPQAPVNGDSAFCFYLAANPVADVVELKADLMLYENDVNSNLFIEVKRNFPDGASLEIRGYILSSGGEAILDGYIYYWDKDGNPRSYASVQQEANFNQYYPFKIVANEGLVKISVGDILLVSWDYDYASLGQWDSGSATIGGGSDTNTFSCKVKNIQAKYYDEIASEPTIEERFEALIAAIKSYDFMKGIENSLVKKVESAQRSYYMGNNDASVNKLYAFINEMEAQTGKEISSEASAYLISEAEAIIELLLN